MNDYRISYIMGCDCCESTITERDEKTALKVFLSSHKGARKTCIKLIREDVPATKAQERDALDKIRDILAPLGPRSYLRTAFEGCLEDAENNIEDDAAYSMKGRLETAEEKLRQEIAEHQATRRELEKTMQALRDTESKIQYLSQAAAEAKARTIPADLWNDIYAIAKERRTAARDAMAAAADAMAHYAERPQDIAFIEAVKRYRAKKERMEVVERLMGRLEGIAPDGAVF